MTRAASRRRGAAVLVLTVLLAALALLAQVHHADAQVLCQDPDTGALEPCATTTTEEDTTTTVDDTTTTTEADSEDTVAPAPEEDEEVVTQSTLTVTTLRDILIPGDGTEGAENTTTTAKALATGGDGLSDETLILLIVGGLGLVAGVVGLLTWRYWTATRPTVADARSTR